MIRRVLTVALASIVAVQPAAAREWPTTAGWKITERNDYSCVMAIEHEGRSENRLSIALDIDNQVTVEVGTRDPVFRVHDEHKIVLRFDRSRFETSLSAGVGPNGFDILHDRALWEAFKASSSVGISMDGTPVDQLSLNGVAAAGAVVEQCLASVRASRIAKFSEKLRRLSLSRDCSFVLPRGASKAKPVCDPTSWVTADDYPSGVTQANEQGRVLILLTVDETGRASACSVEATSGSALLDTTTCMLLQRRARFQPATNEKGEAIVSAVRVPIRWGNPVPFPAPLPKAK